ncbi:MAG TPA: polyprenyl diphosphate synthase, partial [Planctomycetota bacterium]|nr:polyprenyl diphosphate synthase [Planctomycetota bacterium]
KRPKREVDFLMSLLKKYLIQERAEIMDNNIRLTAVGRLEAIPEDVLHEYEKTRQMSASNTGMTLSLALNYGARQEIIDGIRRLAEDLASGKVKADKVDEALFANYLYDAAAPDPDLLIRTGGDIRVSNFLLWQISYTELYVTTVQWPDFRKANLHEAIRDFSARDRRFGAITDAE